MARDWVQDRMNVSLKHPVMRTMLKATTLQQTTIRHEGKYGTLRLLAVMLPKERPLHRTLVLFWPHLKKIEPLVFDLNASAMQGFKFRCPTCDRGVYILYHTPSMTDMRCMKCCGLVKDRDDRNNVVDRKNLRRCRRDPYLYTKKRFELYDQWVERTYTKSYAGRPPSMEFSIRVLMEAARVGAISPDRAATRYWEES